MPADDTNIGWVNSLLAPLDYLGFVVRSLTGSWDVHRSWPRFADQMLRHCAGALPVITLAGAFIGLTTAIQTNYQLVGVVPKYFVGMGVGRMVLIELAPVFAAFIVAGRSASAMAAELGAMRVSEQVDALEVMGIDTHRYLCQPRILATAVGLPILVIVTESIAMVTALLISSLSLGVPKSTFMYGMTHFFLAKDFFGGLAKAVLFGFIIGINGCYYGYNVSGGAEAVGRATTNAVVMSAAMILVTNFLVAATFFWS